MTTPDALLSDLAAAGAPVADVWDFVNTKPTPRSAIPVLVVWLDKASGDDRLLEGLVRALTTPTARGVAGERLLRLFRDIPSGGPRSDSLRWAVGNSLEVVADPSMNEALCDLIQETRYGLARQMVVLAVGTIGDPRSAPVLVNLLADDQVAGHAVIALGRLRVPSTRAAIEPMLQHPKPWVRREAKKALTKLG